MNPIIRIGIDLAKNSFALCGVDEAEKVIIERTLKRTEVLTFFANLPPCLVAMEAGSGAHYWARELKKLGHDPRIIHPSRVASYRHGGKHRRTTAMTPVPSVRRPAVPRCALSRSRARNSRQCW